MPDAPLYAHFLRDLEPAPQNHLRAKINPSNQHLRLSFGSTIPEDLHHKINILIAGRVTEDNLQTCGPNLQTIIIPWAGLPVETRTLLKNRTPPTPEIAVHNLHHNAIPTAEMAVTLLLAAAKVLIPLDQQLRQGDWSPRYAKSNDTILLHNKNALILGFGSIGGHIAAILQGLGMNIRAISRTGKPRSTNQHPTVELHPPAALHDLLPTTDALLVCVPLTDETENLLDETALALLPPTALIVNVARGTVINESALYHALHTKKIRAAGLDVWYNYPKSADDRTQTFPSKFPFHKLPNVVLSPHRGGAVGATEAEHLRYDALAELLNAAAQRNTIPNRVNLELGY